MSNPGPNVVATSNMIQESTPADGHQFGASATALLSFYGATPVVQPTAASEVAVVDGSGGVASATSGIQALTSSYNSAILGNAIASIVVELNGLRSALVTLGLIKGS